MNSAPSVVVHDIGQPLPRRTRKPPAKAARRRGDSTYVAVVGTLTLGCSALSLFDAYLLLSMFAD
jgi:hypothetical protein